MHRQAERRPGMKWQTEREREERRKSRVLGAPGAPRTPSPGYSYACVVCRGLLRCWICMRMGPTSYSAFWWDCAPAPLSLGCFRGLSAVSLLLRSPHRGKKATSGFPPLNSFAPLVRCIRSYGSERAVLTGRGWQTAGANRRGVCCTSNRHRGPPAADHYSFLFTSVRSAICCRQ